MIVDAHQLWHSSSGVKIKFEDGVAIMLFNFKSVFVSTGRDSDKPETINISILSGLPPRSIL